ncbi:TlpA family protein disulfide reductase [Vibrio sp. Of7-15]|uniref:TlpA family protein disulfide reductase n=1 Tax=Vibrio sp. Of7-15 TaxID=2724879 RepID=UPI001EF38702|nr:TlpA disulfide reductase family protein [Vibrio sp. Of7-15]MCG7496170.1 TlpA family protein disulfide reductase [Vibrio sp. Of7-15]
MFSRVLLILSLLFSSHAMAYQQGDQLPEAVQKKLGLKPDELTIIDFFAEWCVSCREELPEVNQLSKELEGSGVVFLGVDVDEDIEVAKKFQAELGLTFPVVNDPSQEIIGYFKPVGMPALYYVYQGQVLKVRFGAINHIRQVIINDLKEMGL